MLKHSKTTNVHCHTDKYGKTDQQPLTSTHTETNSKRYFGTYPGDMEEFVTSAIDKHFK